MQYSSLVTEKSIIKKRHLNKIYLQAETSTCDTAYEEADYMSVIKMANPKLTEPNHIRVFFPNELRPTSSVCSHKHTSDEFKLFDISISISISSAPFVDCSTELAPAPVFNMNVT